VPMPVHASTFWMTKDGNDAGEYEDAFSLDIESKRFAIADGASESSFSKAWAQILASGFTNDSDRLALAGQKRGTDARLLKWLVPLQSDWNTAIPWQSLPWFAAEKAQSGAFAAFLGLELSNVNRGRVRYRWQAVSVGDCMMFKVGDGELKAVFPTESRVSFGSTAPLLCSNPINNDYAFRNINVSNGVLAQGDHVFLCTDALAEWFIAQCRAGEKPWFELGSFVTLGDFGETIAHLRSKRLLHNDDTTMLSIRIE